MSALSPAVAGILHRLTDPTTELLDQAQSLADELAAGLVGVELVDEKGERTFVEARPTSYATSSPNWCGSTLGVPGEPARCRRPAERARRHVRCLRSAVG
jgi:hypothetical protein